ncbi:hypothetical protein ANANG_G00296120, partial [Anguilla anguilla]
MPLPVVCSRLSCHVVSAYPPWCWRAPVPSAFPQCFPNASSTFPQQDVGEEQDQAGRQQTDDDLMERDGALQRVDALLHGAGGQVVVDGGADAPHHPDSVHHGLHGGGHHGEGHPDPGKGRIERTAANLKHTHTHICTHARTHMHIRTHAHAHTHAETHTHICTHARTHMHIRTHAQTHTHARTHAHTHAR